MSEMSEMADATSCYPFPVFLPNLPLETVPVDFSEYYLTKNDKAKALNDKLTQARRACVRALFLEMSKGDVSGPNYNTSGNPIQAAEDAAREYLALLLGLLSESGNSTENGNIPLSRGCIFTRTNFTLTKNNITFGGVNFEVCNVLMALGVTFIQLAKDLSASSRDADQKLAFQYFSKAAGLYNLLAERTAAGDENPSNGSDFKTGVFRGLIDLALAEAQSVTISRNEKKQSPGLIAGLCRDTFDKYSNALANFLSANDDTHEKLCAFLEFKSKFFLAKTYFYASINSTTAETPDYGIGIRNLQLAIDSLTQCRTLFEKFLKIIPKAPGIEGNEFLDHQKQEMEELLRKMTHENDTVYYNRISAQIEGLPDPKSTAQLVEYKLPSTSSFFEDQTIYEAYKAKMDAVAAGKEGKIPLNPNSTGCFSCAPKKSTQPPAKEPFVTPFNKDSRIIIVGAGPSGVHMAHLLMRNGYTNVTVLEKDAEVGGKSNTYYYEYDNMYVPCEMGTTLFHYPKIFDLIERLHLDGKPKLESSMTSAAVNAPSVVNKTVTLKNWILASAAKNSKFGFLPNFVQGIPIFFAIQKYNRLHRQIFGKYDLQIVPPRPTPEKLKLINMSFSDFLKTNGLDILRATFTFFLGLMGYGYLEDIPCYYGLIYVTPDQTNRMLTLDYHWNCVQQGFRAIWNGLVEGDHINVLLRAKCTNIQRNLQDKNAPIRVEYELNGSPQVIEGDFVMLACPLNDAADWMLQDATPEEKELFKPLSYVGCITTLVETTTVPKIEPMAYGLPENLSPDKPGFVFAIWDPLRTLYPNITPPKDKNLVVVYQYYLKYDPNNAEPAKQILVDYLQNEMKWENVKIISQYVPMYFPHFTHQEIAEKEYPWKIVDMQGKYKTWYISAAAAFETSEAVIRNNIWLVETLLAIPNPDGSLEQLQKQKKEKEKEDKKAKGKN